MTERAEHSRIRWRCRRGIKELDLLLTTWVAACWDQADGELRAQFSRLLELPDPELERYLVFQVRPDDPALAALTQSIARIMSSGDRTFVGSAGSKRLATMG